MFSIVQNIGSALDPVQADQPVGDKRHESHQESRNQGELGSEHSATLEESEGSVLSVQAVIMFLEDFLEKKLESQRVVQSNKNDKSFSKWLNKGSANSNSASIQSKKAANVYAHTAKATQNYTYNRAKKSGSSHADLKDIYDLIRDLRQLHEQGTLHLDIEGNQSFLEGIKRAVSDMM